MNRLETQANRMEGSRSGLHARMHELWERKVQVDEKLSALQEQMKEENIMERLAAEVLKHENAVK